MKSLRETSQLVMPIDKPQTGDNEYDIYPSYHLSDDLIFEGYQALAQNISSEKVVIVDGYSGVFWDIFKKELNKALLELGVKAVWWDVAAALKPEKEIRTLVEPFLGGDDPVFGKRAESSLSDYFKQEYLHRLCPDHGAEMNILFGCGAALAGWQGRLIYIDVPKNEIQFRMRAGQLCNLGISSPAPAKMMYKHFYFVDWIVLNKHKKALLPRIDMIIDGQRPDTITGMKGDVLRKGLCDLARNGFRVRPWFEPGAWGGQWIREHINALPHDVPNYAWSFELIVPENGLIFESSLRMLEVSFDMLMYMAGEQVVGGVCYHEYGDEFPIRMDYLDNMDGRNLSLQCHPRKEYAKRHFGEVLTQEETYYVLDCKEDAVVYLGFREGVVPEEFEAGLKKSIEETVPFEVDRFVNALPSEKHGLYLIPPGTLHSSGRNNLVLEISTTPYIFTFKMYDWLTVDLDGKPRPLNIDRGMENLYFDRCGDKVNRELVSHPECLQEGIDWSVWHLPTHAAHSYDVHRLEFLTKMDILTEGKCHVLNLVEGECISVETEGGMCWEITYGETFVVSAAADKYRLVNHSGRPVKVVKAFMKL